MQETHSGLCIVPLTQDNAGERKHTANMGAITVAVQGAKKPAHCHQQLENLGWNVIKTCRGASKTKHTLIQP